MRGIFWEVTARCNLRCKHCYLLDELTYPSQPTNELNTEDCLKIVDQLEETNAFYVTVLGGEPFARPDIMTILRYMGEKKFWTKITTNGTLINEGIACDLADIGIKGVNVSLEGPNAEMNDAIRGKGSFKKAVRAIDYLHNFGIPTWVMMTVNKMNYTSIEKTAHFFLNTGVEKVVFKFYVDFPSSSFSSIMMLDREETFAAAKKISEVKAKYPKGFISGDFGQVLGFLSPESKTAYNDSRFVRCGLGLSQLIILNNGDVISCVYIRDIILGNVMETHLSEIQNSSEFQKIRKLRTLTVDEANEQCSTCEWKYFCGGGCRGRAYLSHNCLSAPDPRMCLLARGEMYG